jgi:hypothetical protein
MDCQLIYNNLIDRAKIRELEGYCEKHHIIPKCMGGDDSLENKIKLTGKEHFFAHLLLIKIYPQEKGLKYTIWKMCNNFAKERGFKITLRTYEEARINFSIERKKYFKNLSQEERKFTEKHKDKIRISKVGFKYSEKSKQKMSDNKNRKEIIKIKLSVPILQFNLNWSFIKEWSSIQEAKKKLHCDAGAYLRGKQKYAANSYWLYKEDYLWYDYFFQQQLKYA